MIPEPLSAYLINIVASVSLGFFKTIIEKDAKQEINTVVDKALQQLIKNKIIRKRERRDFLLFLKKYTDNPIDLSEEDRLKYNKFLIFFNEILPSYQKAYNYLSEKKHQKRFEILRDEINKKFDNEKKQLEQIISELIELRDYDKGKIVRLNKEIEELNKQEAIYIKQIEELSKTKIIDEELYNKSLDLFLLGEIDEAISLLDDTRLEADEKKLFDTKKELAERRILKARLLIIKFQFEQSFKNFEKALEIDNSPENIFEYAKTLQFLNYFKLSTSKYEEALKIYRELAKENPRTYLPYVATTLNNLANLHSDKNEFPQALEKYEEALKIYRELAKENPRTYLPDVAMTLNNLAVLHSAKNEFPQALEKYEEALKIYRELAKENPNSYEIEYAKSLLMGVDLFNRDKSDLMEAKQILVKYKQIPYAQKFIKMIEQIEKK